jgi:hypothetical protein
MKIVAILSTLTLAACASYPGNAPTTSASAQAKVVTTEMPYRAGTGTVTAATRGPSSARRLMIAMSDGSTQVVDTDAPDITVGSRVELTPDRVIRKL